MVDRETEVRGDAGTAAAADFVRAWKAVEAGRTTEPTGRVYMRDRSVLAGILTPPRLDLVGRLRLEPGMSEDALSRVSGRTPAEIRSDVVALAAVGLVERDQDGRLTAPFAEVATTVRFAA